MNTNDYVELTLDVRAEIAAGPRNETPENILSGCFGGNACNANKAIINGKIPILVALSDKLTKLEAELAALKVLLECILPIPNTAYTLNTAISTINDSMGRAYKNEGVTLDEGKIDMVITDFKKNICDMETCINSINEVIVMVETEITETKLAINDLLEEIKALDCHCGGCPDCIREAEEAAAIAAANQKAYEDSQKK